MTDSPSLLEQVRSKKDDEEWQQKLHDKQEDIIQAFGGFANVLELCLINGKDDKSMQPITSQVQSLLQASEGSNKTKRDTKDSSNITISRMNLQRYQNRVTIVKIDGSKNYYFKYFSNRTASIITYDIIGSKYFLSVIPLLAICFAIVGYIFNRDRNFDENSRGLYIVSDVCYCLASLIGTIGAISFNLSSNRDIVWFTLKTFDFWWKVMNTLCVLVAQVILFYTNANATLTVMIFVIIAELSVSWSVFMLDAWYVSTKWKVIVISTVVLIAFFAQAYVYFEYADIYWTPFNISEYAQISWKSAFIGGLFNVTIFTVKPIIFIVRHNIRLMEIMDKNDAKVQKILKRYKHIANSTTIATSPFLEWFNVEASDKNRPTLELALSVSDIAVGNSP